MQLCWKHIPSERPTAEGVVKQMELLMKPPPAGKRAIEVHEDKNGKGKARDVTLPQEQHSKSPPSSPQPQALGKKPMPRLKGRSKPRSPKRAQTAPTTPSVPLQKVATPKFERPTRAATLPTPSTSSRQHRSNSLSTYILDKLLPWRWFRKDS